MHYLWQCFNVSIFVKARPSKRRLANIQKKPPQIAWICGGHFFIVTEGSVPCSYQGSVPCSYQGSVFTKFSRRLRCYVQDNNYIVDLLDFRYVHEQSVVNAFLCSDPLPTSYGHTFSVAQTTSSFTDVARLVWTCHFWHILTWLGVGSLGDKTEQNTSAVSNPPKTSKSRGKDSEKKSNNCKNSRLSLIYSQFLPNFCAIATQKCHKSPPKLRLNGKNGHSS